MASIEALEYALDVLTSPDPWTATHGTFSVETLSASEKDRLASQIERNRLLSAGGNIVGYGIAEKQSSQGPTGVLALTVYVDKKYPESTLAPTEAVPAQLELEGLDEAIPTDVREIGLLRVEALTSRVRPIVGGFSIGHLRATGTMGCLVRERSDPQMRLVLSNCHVFAASGLAREGDPVYQPGPDERDISMEPVASVLRWQPFDFGGAYVNLVDAAVARPVDDTWFDSSIFAIGRPRGVRDPERGMLVQKVGRTTGHTWGRVVDVHFRTALPYRRPGDPGVGLAYFRDQVLCSRYTESGDSGAVVLDAECNVVGLHFCGSPAVSVFSPIRFVLDALQVDIVT